jgi:hypothetical protein
MSEIPKARPYLYSVYYIYIHYRYGRVLGSSEKVGSALFQLTNVAVQLHLASILREIGRGARPPIGQGNVRAIVY